MKRIVILAFLIIVTSSVFGQAWNTEQAKPTGTVPMVTPDNITFYLNKVDTTLWSKLGRYGDFKMFSAKQVQHKIDSIKIQSYYNSGNYYEEEVTVAGTTSYALPDTLKSKSQVWYNGDLLRRSQWNGIGTIYISISGDIRKKDYFTIIF